MPLTVLKTIKTNRKMPIPRNKAGKHDSTIIAFVIYTCAFPTVKLSAVKSTCCMKSLLDKMKVIKV